MAHVLAKELRKAVLQAAFEGKLTQQSTNDMSAVEMVRTMKIQANENDAPFELPDNWSWVKFGDISTYAKTKRKINAQNANPDTWMLDMEDIEKGGKLLVKKKVSERKAIGDKTIFAKGNILYSKLRPYLLKILIADEDGICTPELVPFDMLGETNPRYAMFYLKSPYVDNEINKVTYGIKMPRVGTDTMKNLYFPLPPIEEQARIVARVDELMAKIDEYEKLEKELTELKEKFPGEMRDAILQSALMGNITSQLENDSSTKLFLKKIKNYRKELIEKKEIKNISIATINEENYPYDIPQNWEWERIGNIEEINLGFTYKPSYVENGVYFLSVKDISNGKIDFSKAKKVSQETYDNASYGSKPKKGDILFGRVCTMGKPQIIETDIPFCIFVSLGFFRDHSNLMNKKYVAYWMESILFNQQVNENVKGAAQKNLNTGWLKDFLIPIPPIEEQQRIVDKLDKLLPMCDELANLC